MPGRLTVISHSRLVARHSSFSFFHVFYFPRADSKPRFQSISPERSRSLSPKGNSRFVIKFERFFLTCDQNFEMFLRCPISLFARIFSFFFFFFSIYRDLDGVPFRDDYSEYCRDFPCSFRIKILTFRKHCVWFLMMKWSAEKEKKKEETFSAFS